MEGFMVDEEEFPYGEFEDEDGIKPVDGKLPYHDGPQDDSEGLGAPGNSPRTGAQAIALARSMSKTGVWVGVGYCLKTIRGLYGVNAKYPDASTSWKNAKHKVRVSSGNDVPRGVPVYWTGGSSGYGHIAISTGGGNCWSTDWARPGRIDKARINDITSGWNLKLEGYAWEINDVIVWKPPKSAGTIKLKNIKRGARNSDILKVKAQLYKKGYRGFARKSNKFGAGMQRAYKKYQKKLGYTGADADGIPGKTSLKKLGFVVK